MLDFLEHESKRLVKEREGKQRSIEPLNADRIGTEAGERVKTLEQIARAELQPIRLAPRPAKQSAELRLDGYARHRGLACSRPRHHSGRVTASPYKPQGRRLEARVGELEPIVRADFDAANQPVARQHRATAHDSGVQ
ncbi:MAG: hypothetical protein IPN59_12215 [Holophaga sp.]|nr:hypothetical protein [Holophaga sp.]